MTPGHEALIITAFTMIGLLGALTFTMVSRYRKAHKQHGDRGTEKAT
jgi:hypothetical protein